MIDVFFGSHKDDVIEAAHEAVLKALEECGLIAEGYAKMLCPVDTGNLRNSISHAVAENENACYVGTNNEYAPYVELGTGIYYPGGRLTPWVYVDENGEFHTTRGNPARPFIAPSVSDHADEYRHIIEAAWRG